MSLTSVVLPNGIENIKQEVLTIAIVLLVNIPNSVKQIGNLCFPCAAALIISIFQIVLTV